MRAHPAGLGLLLVEGETCLGLGFLGLGLESQALFLLLEKHAVL
jgi:hypothetical protein